MPASPPSGFLVGRLVAGLAAFMVVAGLAVSLTPARDGAPRPTREADPDPAKPPKKVRAEEEEDKPSKTHKVNDSDDPDTKPAPAPARPSDGDLARAAKETTHPGARKLFRDLAVPFDMATLRLGHSARVEPVAEYAADSPDRLPDPVPLRPIPGETWKADKPVPPSGVRLIEPYEQIALKMVDEYLGRHYESNPDPKMKRSLLDQNEDAQTVLVAVLLFHKAAVENKHRVGPDWKKVEEDLRQRLLAVLKAQLHELTEAKDWDRAFSLARRLIETYPGEEDQKEIAPLVGDLVNRDIKDWWGFNEAKKAAVLQDLRKLADAHAGGKAVKPIANFLEKRAKKFLDEAKQAKADKKDDKTINDLLDQAAENYPTLEGLGVMQRAQAGEHPTLRVGVRELPTRMTPGSAVTDSDRRAVELIFESLVTLSPDRSGGSRWRPALAEGRPRLTPLGREFQLPADAVWSNHERLTSDDVSFTVRMLKGGRGTGLPPAWGDLLEEVHLEDTSRVALTLRQGWLEPLALMQFKVLPLSAEQDWQAFAEHPVGSGPYCYVGKDKDKDRDFVKFSANPYYGARASKFGRPFIENVEFFAYTDPVDEFKRNRLDLALDLTAAQAAALRQQADGLHVTVPEPAGPNRRVYFLAVNNGKSGLDNPAFRCALAYAINRETLLDDHFRAGKDRKVHRALNGPYPVHSWPSDPELVSHEDKTSLDPFDPIGAKAKRQKAADAGVHKVALTLKYPAGDDAVAAAMKDLCEQVNGAKLDVTLTAEAESEAALHHDVEETHSYELAYYHYDFPDDGYWLGPLLCPRGAADGDNLLRYKGELTTKVQDAMRHRHFGEMQAAARVIHKDFLKEEMPFIPLWQLDAFAAVSKDVNAPPTFDPLLVFTDVDQWKLERK